MVKDEKHNACDGADEESLGGRTFDLVLVAVEEDRRVARGTGTDSSHDCHKPKHTTDGADNPANDEANCGSKCREMAVHPWPFLAGIGIHRWRCRYSQKQKVVEAAKPVKFSSSNTRKEAHSQVESGHEKPAA
jgi:hypothetical protein